MSPPLARAPLEEASPELNLSEEAVRGRREARRVLVARLVAHRRGGPGTYVIVRVRWSKLQRLRTLAIRVRVLEMMLQR